MTWNRRTTTASAERRDAGQQMAVMVTHDHVMPPLPTTVIGNDTAQPIVGRSAHLVSRISGSPVQPPRGTCRGRMPPESVLNSAGSLAATATAASAAGAAASQRLNGISRKQPFICFHCVVARRVTDSDEKHTCY